jgi:hypothetical protein
LKWAIFSTNILKIAATVQEVSDIILKPYSHYQSKKGMCIIFLKLLLVKYYIRKMVKLYTYIIIGMAELVGSHYFIYNKRK